MVRLIRLNSANDNAEFDANINTDIILKKDAQIAVRNCSFEPSFSQFISNNISGALNIKPNTDQVDTNNNLKYIVEKTFSLHDTTELTYQTTFALNLGLANRLGSVAGNMSQNGSEFRVGFQRSGDTDNLCLEYRYAPVLNFNSEYCGRNALTVRPPYNYVVTADPPNNIIVIDADFDDEVVMNLPNGTAQVTDERHRVLTSNGVTFCKGSGFFIAQIDTLSGGGGDQGFGIGLSFGDGARTTADPTLDNIHLHPGDNSIPDTLRNIEISIKHSGANYIYRNSNKGVVGGDADSGVGVGLAAGTNKDRNDILILEMTTNVSNKVIIGSVIKYAGGAGSKTQLFSHILSTDDYKSQITPYLFLREDGTKCKLKNVCFTLSPFYNAQHLVGGPTDPETGLLPAFDYDYSSGGLVDASMANLLPKQSPGRFSEIDNPTGNAVFSQVTMDNSLARLLGFDREQNDTTSDVLNGILTMEVVDFGPGGEYETTNGVRYYYGGNMIRAPFEPKVVGEEDCYIIELQDILLESFNSQTHGRYITGTNVQHSEGARKNILDVIPVSSKLDTPKIEYAPNELVYCNILNSENMNIRNMKLRIVDGDFQNIATRGESEILLVIKD